MAYCYYFVSLKEKGHMVSITEEFLNTNQLIV